MPLLDLSGDVGADQQTQRPVAVLRLDCLDGVQRTAWGTETLLDARHLDAGKPAKGSSGHLEPVLKRLEPLAERVLEHRHHQHALDQTNAEHVRERQHVPHVRWVEASTEQADSHALQRLLLRSTAVGERSEQ
jgi:hypothetical protein